MRSVRLLTLLAALATPICTLAGPGVDLGYHPDTELRTPSAEEICSGATLLLNDDGDFENSYAWQGGGALPPDYGSWAECYNSDFVCGIQFFFTQNGYYLGQTMDVYVWDSNADGDPPPGPDPGNVVCVLVDVAPGPIAMWPEISMHDVRVCCEVGTEHFVGFWGNWPGLQNGWFIAADEDGPGLGCPRTNSQPGLGYPSGWQHPSVIAAIWENCKDMGIREYAGMGDCPPTATASATWGRIKSLY